MRDQETILTGATPQAVTAAAYSVNTYDLGGARDIGSGEPIYVDVRVVQAFNNLTNLEIQLVTSANADLSSHTVVATSGTILLAALTANSVAWRTIVPPGKRSQYMGFRFIPTGTAPTTGTLDATMGRREWPNSYVNAVA